MYNACLAKIHSVINRQTDRQHYDVNSWSYCRNSTV